MQRRRQRVRIAKLNRNDDIRAEVQRRVDRRRFPESAIEQIPPLVRHWPCDERNGDARLDRVDQWTPVDDHLAAIGDI